MFGAPPQQNLGLVGPSEFPKHLPEVRQRHVAIGAILAADGFEGCQGLAVQGFGLSQPPSPPIHLGQVDLVPGHTGVQFTVNFPRHRQRALQQGLSLGGSACLFAKATPMS